MKQRLVIVGSGMASGRLLEHMFETGPMPFDVTLFGAERHGNYNRILLSPVLAGEENFQEIVTHDAAWYEKRNIVCRFGESVTRIDRARKVVISRNGETPYDKLVLATGSIPFVPPVAGRDLAGVVSFRDLDDVEAMLAMAARPNAKAVVVGGGLLGLEAAAALQKRGMNVTVLHLMGHLMELQLDPSAGALLQHEFERRGIHIHCRAQTKALLGHKRVEAVLLDDGTIYPADLVVMAAGIRPETRIATDSGLQVERGIVVDAGMCTSDPDILALGECAEHEGRCYGFVEPLYAMAAVAAKTLFGIPDAFRVEKFATNLKVSGVQVFSAGDFTENGDSEAILFDDPAFGVYRKFVLRSGRLSGVILVGDVTDGAWYLELIRSEQPIGRMRDALAFGRALAMRKAA